MYQVTFSKNEGKFVKKRPVALLIHVITAEIMFTPSMDES
jgi:hypothetical protein